MSRTMFGARMVVYVNGRQFGLAEDFSFQSATPKNAIYGIDSTEPFELAVTSTKVAGSMTIFRTENDGGAQGAQMVPNYANLPNEKYFTLAVVDLLTDQLFFFSTTCSVQSEAWKVDRNLIRGQIQFEALEWVNELSETTTI